MAAAQLASLRRARPVLPDLVGPAPADPPFDPTELPAHPAVHPRGLLLASLGEHPHADLVANAHSLAGAAAVVAAAGMALMALAVAEHAELPQDRHGRPAGRGGPPVVHAWLVAAQRPS